MPIIINIKCAKLYIDSIVSYNDNFRSISDCDVHITPAISDLMNQLSMYDSARSSVTESSDLDDIDSINAIGNLNSEFKKYY